LKTLATLQSISNLTGRPVIANVHMNTSTTPRAQVDKDVDNALRAIALLVSGANSELDDKDLRNWLNFDKVTEVPSQLVDLVINSSERDDEPMFITGISVASLLPSYEHIPIDLQQPYSCCGYLPDGVLLADDKELDPIHYIITNDLMSIRVEELNQSVSKFKEVADKLAASAIFEVGDGTEDGMIL